MRSSFRLRSPSEFLRSSSFLPPKGGRVACQGSFPHRGIIEVRPLAVTRPARVRPLSLTSRFAAHSAGSEDAPQSFPALYYVPPTGFLDLSTVFSTPRLAGLFRPAATSRVVSRSGASLSAQTPCLVGRSFLPPVQAAIAFHPKTEATMDSLGSEALLRAEQRSRRHSDWPRRLAAPLLGFPSSRSFALVVADRSPGGRPLMRLARSPFACALADRTSPTACLLRKPWSSRLRSDRPARGFEPALRFPSNEAHCPSSGG